MTTTLKTKPHPRIMHCAACDGFSEVGVCTLVHTDPVCGVFQKECPRCAKVGPAPEVDNYSPCEDCGTGVPTITHDPEEPILCSDCRIARKRRNGTAW